MKKSPAKSKRAKHSDGFTVRRKKDYWLAEFSAMASPCEVHVRCQNRAEAEKLASLAFSETRRIERKYSRYRDDNIIYKINTSNGSSVSVDEETVKLLNYAQQCYNLSEGMFDITSGVLRRGWQFRGTDFTPDETQIESLRILVGWDKISWDGKAITLLPGMEIDLGGIGKEYAVDKVAERLHKKSGYPVMVNFGGDIRVINGNPLDEPWSIGIEDPELEDSAVGLVGLSNGGVATSGDTRRFCVVDGKRLSHILNPLTGWPVEGAPRSVTVIAQHCTEAGILATLAMLHGIEAEEFLKAQGVQHHCSR